LTASQSVLAFIDNLAISPASPIAENSFQFSVRAGGCHLITGQPLEYVVVDNTVRMTLDVADNSSGVGFCIFPEVTRTYTLPGLSAGGYRFELWRRRSTQPIIPTTFVGAVDFNVVAGTPPPIAVPAGGRGAWLALAVSCLVAGMVAVRRRWSGAPGR
jgi:hypothetical protein